MVRHHSDPKAELDILALQQRLMAEFKAQYRRFSADPEASRIIANLPRELPSTSAPVVIAAGQAAVRGALPPGDVGNVLQPVATKDMVAQSRAGLNWADIGRYVGATLGGLGHKFFGYNPLAAEAGQAVGGVAGKGVDIPARGVGAVIPESVRGAGKDVVRGVTTAGDVLFREGLDRPLKSLAYGAEQARVQSAPGRGDVLEELGIQFREAREAYDRFGPSAGLRALRGEGDLGEGFFPGGSAEATAEAQRQSLVSGFDGQPVTVGRTLASTVLDPDSQAFGVVSGAIDVGLQIVDPGAAAFGAGSKIVKGRRVFIPASEALEAERRAGGLLDGLRKAVSGTDSERWLTASRPGQAFTKWAVDTRDAYEIWTRMGRDRVPHDVAVALADAQTADDVHTIMRGVLGTDIRSTTDLVGGLPSRLVGLVPGAAPLGRGLKTRLKLDSVRLLRDVPGTHVNRYDIDGAAATLDDWLANAKVDRDVRAEIVGKALRLDDVTSHWEDVFDVAVAANRKVFEKLTGKGMSDPIARQLTKMYKNYQTGVREYAIDAVGNPIPFPGSRTALIAGEEVPVSSAQLLSEYADTAIPLGTMDDVRAIRRSTGALSRIYQSKLGKLTYDGIDLVATLQEKIWKPAVLLRAAIIPRVVGEEQVRMAGAGYHSAFNHPISYFAYLAGKKDATDLAGNPLVEAEKFVDALSRRGSGYVGASGKDIPSHLVATGDWVPIYRSATDVDTYLRAWGGELGQLAADPVARKVAGGLDDADIASLPEHLRELPPTSLEAVYAWFDQGAGRQFLERLAHGGPGKRVLLEPGESNKYIDSVLARIEAKTSNNPELVNAIATGTLDGVRIGTLETKVSDITGVLKRHYDSSPDVLKAERTLVDQEALRRYLRTADRAIDWGFEHFLSMPTNFFSRSPVFTQAYARRVEEGFTSLTGEAQSVAIQWAKDNGYKQAAKRMTKRSELGVTGNLGFEDLDLVAKSYGLKVVKDLLYDTSKKSQIADALRVVHPFLEPWKEMMTIWPKLVTENPAILRRGHQVVSGGERAGWFQREDDGELYFTYPVVGSLAAAFLPEGTSVRAKGRVSGLNLAAQFVPGAGPVVQILASHLLPDTPDWDGLREMVLPFGPAKIEDPGDAVTAFLPAWAKKAVDALFEGGPSPELVGTYGDHLAQTIRLLSASGDYDPTSEEGKAKLIEDAQKAAKRTLGIRALAQFFLPTGPEMDWEIQDKDRDARWFTTQALMQEFRETVERHGGFGNPDAEFLAWEEFVAAHGYEPHVAIQGKTARGKGRAQTEEGINLERMNPELVARYPNTIGYFFDAPDDDLELKQWDRLLENGSRIPLTPEQMLQAAQNRRAWSLYRHAQQQVGDRTDAEARAYLASVRAAIAEENPYWRDEAAVPKGVSREVQLAELHKAAFDPELADNEVAQGLRLAFEAVDKAQAAAAQKGRSSWTSSKDTQHLRDWLGNTIFPAISKEFPNAAPVLERLWLRDGRIKWGDDVLPESPRAGRVVAAGLDDEDDSDSDSDDSDDQDRSF